MVDEESVGKILVVPCCMWVLTATRKASSLLHVGLDGHAESVFASLHEVAPSTTMCVDFHTAGDDVGSLGIDERRSHNGQVAVGHFQNLIVPDEHRAVFQPALRGKNAGVNNLC